jgi:nucleotide-binding universal stress UspA family protein
VEEMKKILIAADGSPTGRAAVEAGVELAADEGASVVVVHVVSILDFAESANGDGAPRAQRLPRLEEDPVLEAALAAAAARRVEATAELLIGYPPTQIVRLAAEIDADLIVVGCRGLNRIKGAFFGSTSRDVLAHAQRPVFVVRPLPAGEPAAV